MKAVLIENHGGPEVLQICDLDTPEPGPGQVRVKVRAAALNHLDLWVRRGIPGVRYPLPLIPGCDGAGEVEALGEGVDSIAIGTEVLLAPGVACGACVRCARGDDNLCRGYGILGEHLNGTCAESVVVPRQNVIPKPGNISFTEAAAFPLVFLTAWNMIVKRAELRPGETILIHAAGSGVSTAGIQIAKLLGARVVATAGTSQKLDLAERLGADLVLNYRDQDWASEVRAFTRKAGVEVIFDHVGKDTWEDNIKSLTQGGRLVFCGNTSGPRAETSLPHVFFKNLSLLGSTMGSRGAVYEITQLIARGQLKPIVDSEFCLDQVSEAHEILENRKAFGKVVLTV